MYHSDTVDSEGGGGGGGGRGIWELSVFWAHLCYEPKTAL